MRPLVIGIAGGTGSGKSTVARNIAAALPAERVALIDHDSYYRDRSDLTIEERIRAELPQMKRIFVEADGDYDESLDPSR